MDGISRRAFGVFGLAAVVASKTEAGGLKPAAGQFGQINKLTAKEGQLGALHAELFALTTSLIASLPDALTYEVLSDDRDPSSLWTIELWSSEQAHAAAVATQNVQTSIARCKPMIKRFENLATFTTAAPVIRGQATKLM